jgi:hypothetical protein
MPGLANDFVADAAVDAAFAGFAQMGLVKGTAAAVITPIAAGVVTTVALAVPLVVIGGLGYLLLCALDDGSQPNQAANGG